MKFSNQKKIVTTLVAIAIAGGISACSTSSQDSGSSNNGVSLNGLVVDGYVAYSTVYIDSNENGKLDVFEARAITDSDGYYSINVDGTISYCDLPAGDNRHQHCLSSGAAISEGTLLRFVGGYDISTGEQFEGTLSARVPADTTNPIVATPLTTLMSYMDDAAKAQFVTNNPPLTLDDLESDFLKNAQSGGTMTTVEAQLMRLALQAQKAVDVISNAIEMQNPGIFGEGDNPSDASGTVYEELAKLASADGATDLLTLFANAANTRALTTNSATAAGSLYGATAFTLGGIAANVDAITSLIRESPLLTELASIEGLSRTAELAAEAVRGSSADRSTAITTALNDPIFIGAMAAAGANVGEAKRDIETIMTSANPVALIASDYTRDATTQFPTATVLGGQEVRFSRDSGSDAFILYMHSPTDSSDVGSLSACGRYTSPGVGDTNYTTGIKLDGTWERLNDYTLLLSIGVSDSREQVTVSALDFNDSVWDLGFNYQDEQGTWSSENTFTDTTDIPANDADCATILAPPLS